MKTSLQFHRQDLARRFLPFTLLAAGLVLAGFAGCAKSDKEEAKTAVKDAYADTKSAVADAWADAKSFTFDQREKFSANAKALSSKMESRLSEMRANYAEDKASASRKAAMAELKNSEADYKEKCAALSQASGDTWESAKKNAIASWDRLQAAYDKARAD